MPRRVLLCLTLALTLPAALSACLWDRDTLQQERSRFPSALELITGKFLRHSPEFCEWRIRDREEKLKYDPDNLALIDDLAVAHDKAGRPQQAVRAITPSYEKDPARYQTLANLGTFHIHAGHLEKGAEFIDRAIRINPDAHFGREKYQKYLVEYVLSSRQGGKTSLPLRGKDDRPGGGFVAFLRSQKPAAGGKRPSFTPEEHAAALKGVLGMMRFGHHDSPVLLEALGDLLAPGYEVPIQDAKQLAARAYLKASYEVKDEAAQKAYRELARAALAMQTRGSSSDQLPLAELEADFRKELDDAANWYADLAEKEKRWLQEEPDPEAAFARLYAEEPEALSTQAPRPVSAWALEDGRPALLVFVTLGVLGMLVLAGVGKLLYRARRSTP